jgi:hypothetical protein
MQSYAAVTKRSSRRMQSVILTVAMQSLTNLSDVLLNVVMLNVAAPTWLSYLHILSTAGLEDLLVKLACNHMQLLLKDIQEECKV